jgi:hypothetical protein
MSEAKSETSKFDALVSLTMRLISALKIADMEEAEVHGEYHGHRLFDDIDRQTLREIQGELENLKSS